MASSCQQRLVDMDSTTAALKKRIERLAKRESDRMRLLLRAEAAWKDLEQNYIDRLSGAEEREEEIIKQIKNLICERSNHKQACVELSKQLEERMVTTDKVREELKNIEKEVCERARKKLRLSEEATGAEAALAQEHCRSAKYDRDLRSKEEQARRKLTSLQNEVESSRALRYEAERALRAELGALKDQVSNVSKRLLTEETDTNNLKNEIKRIKERKSQFIEDLDACKLMCDNKMQGKMTELTMKTEKLNEIKEKVLECRCKRPQDNSIEAKRTPSLAAVCRCTSDDKLQDSCSCKSLRNTILSNLLKNLFEGLQSELCDSGSIMPCELLKCLEDSHNWDRTTPVKTNLRNFFAKLLVGELDIAIASSIEKYHARWIGDTCADRKNVSDSELTERQQLALENRAQRLAEQLAEKLFQERADKLMKTAKNMMNDSQPPCECSNRQPAATFSCVLKTNMEKSQRNHKIKDKTNSTMKENTGRIVQNQASFQKTKSLKKGSLKPTKERITRQTTPVAVVTRKGQILNHRAVCTDKYENASSFLIHRARKKYVDQGTRIDSSRNSYFNQNVSTNSYLKGFKKLDQSYAVNLCLYEPYKDQNLEKPLPYNKIEPNCSLDEEELGRRRLNSSYFLEDIPSIELANSVLQPFVIRNENSREGDTLICSKTCLCFNNVPNNYSLDNILESYRTKNIAYSSACNDIGNDIIYTNQERIGSPYHLDKFDKSCEDEKRQKITPDIWKNNNRESVFQSELIYNDVDGFDAKGMNCEVTQAPSKSKFNCKDVEVSTPCDYQTKILAQDQNINRPMRDQCSKFTNIERKLCDIKTSAPSFCVPCNSASLNVIKNYVVDTSKDPLSYDCNVDLLGVTLHNSENKNKFTNKPSKEKKSEVMEQVNRKDKSENGHLKILNNKFDKRNTETSISADFKQNDDENLLLLDSKNNCVCGHKDGETCELEVNAFSLLTEYLQKKLEQYKLKTNRSSNISPFKVDLLFNQILENVKKMILESSKEMTCHCFNRNESNGVDACWRRACGLLQEYLRAKIKRLECSCSNKTENTGTTYSLPKILEKICKMIENDFERLKTISKDTNSLKYIKTHSSEKQITDTKIDDDSFNIKEDLSNVCSKKTSLVDSPKNILFNGEVSIKNSQINEEKKYVPNTKDKSYSYYSNNSGSGTKKNNSAKNSLDPCSSEMDHDSMFISMLIEGEEHDNTRYANPQSMSVPCVTYNVDCACDRMLGQCYCTKSNLKRNLNLKEANTSSLHILQNTLSTNPSKPIAYGYNDMQKEKETFCEKEIETLANKEIVELKESECKHQKGANNSTNTHPQFYDDIDYLSYDEWDDCESVPYHEKISDIASNNVEFYNSLLLPLNTPKSHINKTLLSNSDDMVMCSSIRSHNCECEMVPICHVKMLIDNIEKKLFNFKCTCDSLHPSVCPAHSETVSQ